MLRGECWSSTQRYVRIDPALQLLDLRRELLVRHTHRNDPALLLADRRAAARRHQLDDVAVDGDAPLLPL